jgi:predicted site-specific integrase-resolvase
LPEKVYNGEQAVMQLGISRTELGRWIKRGQIKPVKRQSNVLLFDKATVDQLARTHS